MSYDVFGDVQLCKKHILENNKRKVSLLSCSESDRKMIQLKLIASGWSQHLVSLIYLISLLFDMCINCHFYT